MKLQHSLLRLVLLFYITIFSFAVGNSQSGKKSLTYSQSTDPSTIKIIIDPGHGGKDHGCQGNHKSEKNEVLQIAFELERKIKALIPHAEVYLTRRTDKFISLAKRIETVNELHGDLFLSLHCNSNEYASTSGSEIFVGGLDFVNAHQHNDHHHSILDESTIDRLQKYTVSSSDKMVVLKNSLDLAKNIEKRLESFLPYKSRGVKEEGYAVLKYTNTPGVLIEAGFLTNRNEARFLSSSEGRGELASAIAHGILEFYQNNINRKTPSFTSSTKFEKRMEETDLINKYTIQIASSFKRPILRYDDKWNNLDSLNIIQKDDHYHYRVGDYLNISQAEKALIQLHDKGFSNAFIINESYVVPGKKWHSIGSTM